MRRSLAGSGLLAFLLSAALGSANPIALAAPQANLVLTVNSEADAPATGLLNNGICQTAIPNQCTLRAAIMKANNWHSSSVTILLPGLPAGHKYLLTDGPLGGDDDSSGDLNLYPAAGRPSVTIQGSDPFNTIIDGSGLAPADRVLSIAAGVTTTISFVTIQGGQSGNGGGLSNGGRLTMFSSNIFNNQAVSGGPQPGLGGGLYNTGTVTLTDDLIEGNDAAVAGGGIENGGRMSLVTSSVSGNTSTFLAGGISNDGGSLTLNQTEVDGNLASRAAGISNVIAMLTMTDSSLVYNIASSTSIGGGGLYNNCGLAALVNSTVSMNAAYASGGGIDNEDFGCGTLVKLRGVTVASNTAAANGGGGQGGGIFNSSGATVDFRNTILSNNQLGAGAFNPSDCGGPGPLSSKGSNLISSLAGCNLGGGLGDIYDQFALLRPLDFNGGITLNHALLPNSPAVDAGFPGGCFDASGIGLTTDQRGAPRTAFGGHSFRCDIGAYELQQTLDLPLLRR